MANEPYTAAKAAQELDLSIPTIYKLLERGALTRAPVVGKTVLVTAQSVRAYKRNTGR